MLGNVIEEAHAAWGVIMRVFHNVKYSLRHIKRVSACYLSPPLATLQIHTELCPFDNPLPRHMNDLQGHIGSQSSKCSNSCVMTQKQQSYRNV